jgi:hypothetical protein
MRMTVNKCWWRIRIFLLEVRFRLIRRFKSITRVLRIIKMESRVQSLLMLQMSSLTMAMSLLQLKMQIFILINRIHRNLKPILRINLGWETETQHTIQSRKITMSGETKVDTCHSSQLQVVSLVSSVFLR